MVFALIARAARRLVGRVVSSSMSDDAPALLQLPPPPPLLLLDESARVVAGCAAVSPSTPPSYRHRLSVQDAATAKDDPEYAKRSESKFALCKIPYIVRNIFGCCFPSCRPKQPAADGTAAAGDEEIKKAQAPEAAAAQVPA